MRYVVKVSEILARNIEVEADSECDALDKVRLMYKNLEFLLNSDNFTGEPVFEVIESPYSWLKEGVEYFYPTPDSDLLYNSLTYAGDEEDEKMKERRMAFKTKKEAIEAAEKMLEALK